MKARIAITAIALVAAACATADDDPTTTSAPEVPDPGQVVWTSTDGIFVRNVAAGTVERIGPIDSTVGIQATPGPDGSVAWSELTATGGQVAIRDAAGVVTRLDGPTVPFYYSWSPGGDRLAFLGSGPTSLVFGVVENGVARQLDSGAPYYFDWAPDGDALFVHRVGNDLSLLTLDGERVVIDESPAAFQAPQWDALGVIYARPGAGAVASGGYLLASADDPADLVMAPAPGEPPTVIAPLTDFSSFDRAGERVAVLTFDEPPTGTLRILDIAAGTTEDVADGVVAHRWSPDGEKLLMLLTRDTHAVWAVWQTGTVTELAAHRPTGRFVRDYLPFWDQYARSLTPWSPMSDAFVFTGFVDDELSSGVYVQHLDGRRERLADGTTASWSPSAATDGPTPIDSG